MPEAAERTGPLEPWVVEGTIDFPVELRMDTGKTPAAILISLGGEDPDGFMQLRPQNVERASASVWWTASERVAYDCRGLVRAPNPAAALHRGRELFEHVADRLTFLGGYPVEVLSVGMVYNEGQLKQCIAGHASEFDATTGGEASFRTKPAKNAHLLQLLTPPAAALEAMRWFRHAMLSARTLDQFLYYHTSLESIAKHVPGVTRGPRRDAQGKEEKGLESIEAAAIKHLLQRRNLPLEGRRTIATIRARIAHGNTDLDTIMMAHANMRAVQRLAADAIALVFGIVPDLLRVFEPSPVLFMAPILKAKYLHDDNPATRWGSLLSDEFAKYMRETARRAVPEQARPPSN